MKKEIKIFEDGKVEVSNVLELGAGQIQFLDRLKGWVSLGEVRDAELVMHPEIEDLLR